MLCLGVFFISEVGEISALIMLNRLCYLNDGILECPKFQYLCVLCFHQGSSSSTVVVVIVIDEMVLVAVVVALVRGLVFTLVHFVSMVVPGNRINLKNHPKGCTVYLPR